MNVVIFGATGMVGQGVLLECIRSSTVSSITTITRRSLASRPDWASPKVRQIVVKDVTAFESALGNDARSKFDACFFCLGVTSAGMGEQEYTTVTRDLTLAVAERLGAASRGLCFIYLSGAGADSSEQSSVMWARIRGQTENAVLAMPSLSAYVMRPALIQPLDGVRSTIGWYNILYTLLSPVLRIMKAISPSAATTTRNVGRAMITTARDGSQHKVLHTKEINAAAGS